MKSTKNYEVWAIVAAYVAGMLIVVLLGQAGAAFGLNKKLTRLNTKASLIDVSDWEKKCADLPSLAGCDGTVLPVPIEGDLKGVSPRSPSRSLDGREGQINLVKNNSFETPIVTVKSTLLPGDEQSLGWYVAWVKPNTAATRSVLPVVELMSSEKSGWTARDGKQFAKLDIAGSVSDSLVTLSQDIVTERATYLVSLWIAGQPGTKGTENTVKVYWNGELLETVSQDGTQSKDTVWQRFFYTVQGIDGISQLLLVPGGKADGKGVLVDNVSVIKQ